MVVGLGNPPGCPHVLPYYRTYTATWVLVSTAQPQFSDPDPYSDQEIRAAAEDILLSREENTLHF